MSYIKEKSGFNIDSARHLIDNNLYAPSVHCSYYGSFQFMKHKLKDCRKTTFEQIESDGLNYNRGTHGYIIDNILSELRKSIIDTKEYIAIKRKIKDLKEFRIKSDYLNVQILIDDAEKCFSYSETIIQSIKSNIK